MSVATSSVAVRSPGRHARQDPSGGRDTRVSRRRIVGWVLTGMLVVTWFVALRPASIGGPLSLVGVHGISMTPTLLDGDLAIARHQSDYHVGDVIVYRIPAGQPGAGSDVIHRIVSGDGATGFTTQGDHNGYPDHYWHPRTQDVIGRVWLHLPGLATQISRLRQPWMLASAVGLLTFAVIAWPPRRRSEPAPTDP